MNYRLSFTRPNAGREVEQLNWTQEHKSVWDGPASKATGHAPKPARDWPVPLSYYHAGMRAKSNHIYIKDVNVMWISQ